MTKLDEARNILKQHTNLTTIINRFCFDGEVGHVLYFTEEESAILAEYLINNGIIAPTVKENEQC